MGRCRELIIRDIWGNRVNTRTLTFPKSYRKIKIRELCMGSWSLVICCIRGITGRSAGGTKSGCGVGRRCLLYTWIIGGLAGSDGGEKSGGIRNSTIGSRTCMYIVYTNKSSSPLRSWEVVMGKKGTFSIKVTSRETRCITFLKARISKKNTLEGFRI